MLTVTSIIGRLLLGVAFLAIMGCAAAAGAIHSSQYQTTMYRASLCAALGMVVGALALGAAVAAG